MSRDRAHPRVDPNNPEAYGQCDRCLAIVFHKTLRREMKYEGDALVWNGLLICSRPRCIDKPHPQSKTKKPRPDPISINNARPDDTLTGTVASWVQQSTPQGATALRITSATGFVVGDTIQVSLDNQTRFKTTITAINSNILSLAAALTFKATAGNLVIDLTQSPSQP